MFVILDGGAKSPGWQDSAGHSTSHPVDTVVFSEAVGAPEVMRSIIKSQREVV